MQQNFLKIYFGTKEALEASWEGQKSHEVETTHLVSCGPLLAHLRVKPTPKNPIYSETPRNNARSEVPPL